MQILGLLVIALALLAVILLAVQATAKVLILITIATISLFICRVLWRRVCRGRESVVAKFGPIPAAIIWVVIASISYFLIPLESSIVSVVSHAMVGAIAPL